MLGLCNFNVWINVGMFYSNIIGFELLLNLDYLGCIEF